MNGYRGPRATSARGLGSAGPLALALALAAILFLVGVATVLSTPGWGHLPAEAAAASPLADALCLPATAYLLSSGDPAAVIHLSEVSGTFLLSGGPLAARPGLTYTATMRLAVEDVENPAASAVFGLPARVTGLRSVELRDIKITLDGVSLPVKSVAGPAGAPPELSPGVSAGRWATFTVSLAKVPAAGTTLKISYVVGVPILRTRAVTLRVLAMGLAAGSGAAETSQIRFAMPGYKPWHVDYVYPASLIRYEDSGEWVWNAGRSDTPVDIVIGVNAQLWTDSYLSKLDQAARAAKNELLERYAAVAANPGERLTLWPLYETARAKMPVADPPAEEAVFLRYVLASLTEADVPPTDEPACGPLAATRDTEGKWTLSAQVTDRDADLLGWRLEVYRGTGTDREVIAREVSKAWPPLLRGAAEVEVQAALPRLQGMWAELTAFDAAGHVVTSDPIELTRNIWSVPAFWGVLIVGLAALALLVRRRVLRSTAKPR